MRIATDGKLNQIGKCRATALRFDVATSDISPNDLGNFDVEQMRRMQRLPTGKKSPLDSR